MAEQTTIPKPAGESTARHGWELLSPHGLSLFPAVAALSLASGLALFVVHEKTASYSLVDYKAHLRPVLPLLHIGGWSVLWMLFWAYVCSIFYRQAQITGKRFAGKDMLGIFFPILPLSLLAFLPPGVYSPLLLVFCFGLATLRGFAGWQSYSTHGAELPGEETPGWAIPGLITLGAMLMAWVGYCYQIRALNSLHLICGDWTCYLSAVDNTLNGEWFKVDGKNFLASHFSPGSILLMCPYVWLFRDKEAFFVLNSAILYCNVPLFYWLLRTLLIPRRQAGVLALCMLLSPSLINLNVSLFYGFHDIILVMPLILLFFIMQEKKIQWAAWCCFALSLTIKETVPVFWAGVGLVLMFGERRKTGLVLFLGSCAYWLLVMKVFIPAISNMDKYDYSCRFLHLGGSVWEIAASPVLKPRIFFSHLLRPCGIYFVAMLLLPVIFVVANRPLLLFGSSLTIAFVCVQSTDQLQNIHMQYQAETVILFFVCAGYNLQWLLGGRGGAVSGALCRLADARLSNIAQARACLAATLVAAAGSFWFFGEHPWSKVENSRYLRSPEHSQIMAAVKSMVPPGIPVQATLNLGGHFILRNPVAPDLGGEPAPYVVLDLHAGFHDKRDLDELRRRLLANGYKAIYAEVRGHIHIVILAKSAEAPACSDFLSPMSDAEWLAFGQPVEGDFPPGLQARFAILNTPVPAVQIRTRLLRKADIDYNLLIGVPAKDGRMGLNIFAFGNGVTPAFMAAPGKVYTINHRVGPDHQFEMLAEPRQ